MRVLAQTANLQVFWNHRENNMKVKNEKWQSTVLSDINYEHLVAELTFDGQFLLLLDREQGRDTICVAFPDKNGALQCRIPLVEFIEQLQTTAADLRR